MSFKSRLIHRLRRPVDPVGYICMSLFLPLSIIQVSELWPSKNEIRLVFYVFAVMLLIPLWFWTSLKALAEIRWSKYWVIPLALPLVLLLLAEMKNWRNLERGMLGIQFIDTVALMVPTPCPEQDSDSEENGTTPTL